MGSLGTILRREREARGITLEEIAAKTKIGIRLLRAIEGEQFDKLPGGLFNKSFVRQYARIVGVDEEVAMREYLQAFGARREAVPAVRSRPPEPRVFATEADYARVIPALLGIGILMAGLAYGGYRLYGYLTAGPALPENGVAPLLDSVFPGRPAPRPEEALAASEEQYEAPAAEESPEINISGAVSGGESEPLIATALPAVETAAATAATPGSGQAEELQLRIDSHGIVWLSITADGVRQWQGTMRANQSREVQAAESVRLTVGDAGAVSLTLNGKSLPGLGRPGEVRNLTITARDAAVTSP